MYLLERFWTRIYIPKLRKILAKRCTVFSYLREIIYVIYIVYTA